ncbi:S53 family peptidase [Acidianus manzaensis]|uniref:Peptidase S53 n=1 Tax=Acidianus manzaensis TaxID=282676 RepID=A0A1W6JXF5_9CREN|nr:S8 family serine peptidase [Acidianus manzaensis]ARM74981.1 peptidase S53 [Acidianus manzaensis]
MFKTLMILALLLTQVIPFISSVNLTNNHQDISLQSINPNSFVTIAIVETPKNLALLQMYVENHIILNSTEVYNLFIPNNTINNIVDYLHRYNINTTTYYNVVLASGPAKSLEKALNGTIYVNNFNSIRFYQFLGDPPSIIGNAEIFGTNITAALLAKPNTIYNVSQAVAYNYVLPSQLQEAYNTTWLYNHGITGNGTTIGILDFCGDPYIIQQLDEFDNEFNISNPPFLQIQPIGCYNPNNGIETGWALEISLDVEYSHEIAPNAGIILYVANEQVPLPAAIAFIDQQDKVNVVSQSFGIPEIYVDLGLIPLSYVQSLTYEYWLGEVEGITFIAASGDEGGNGNNFYLFPEGNDILPSSDPYVLAAGGATLYSSGSSSVQTAWSGESVYGATTGGYSSIFPSPWYQGLNGFRSVPDVVADANPYSGVPVVYYHNEVCLVGGTSVASPTIAGIIDLASEVHGKLGFINPMIYALNGTKALVPIDFGYNTPYIVNSTPNPVTGLGYINAGYFVMLVHNVSTISVATTNSTYLDGEIAKVIVKASPLVPVQGYVYNGSTIIERFPLVYNGSYWIGEFSVTGSGIEEIVIKQGNEYTGTYITVGLQAEYILPEVGVYTSPGSMPILAELIYPNGTGAIAPNNLEATVYKYIPSDNSFSVYATTELSVPSIILLSSLNIIIINNGSFVYGTFNDFPNFGGIYMVKISGIFGFDEYVEGAYVLPYIVPSAFTEPTVISPGSNITIGVSVEAEVYPNITFELVSTDGKIVYSTTINSVDVNGQIFYVKQITLPKNIEAGYYYIIAKAIYEGSNYSVNSYGYTQIYVSPYSLNVKLLSPTSSALYENQSFILRALITYPNGTPVKFGIFNAVIIPSYLAGDFDSLDITFSTPLIYHNGYWIANITTPSGNSNPLGYSTEGLAGNWYIYIYGVSSSGVPISFPASLDYSSLAIVPSTPNKIFSLLPYIYTSFFNGTIAVNMYIQNAVIINHDATFIDTIIQNLEAKNSTITLINSQVIHEKIDNSKIISNENITSDEITTNTSSTISPNTTINGNNVSNSKLYVLVSILVVVLAIFFVLIKKLK